MVGFFIASFLKLQSSNNAVYKLILTVNALCSQGRENQSPVLKMPELLSEDQRRELDKVIASLEDDNRYEIAKCIIVIVTGLF